MRKFKRPLLFSLALLPVAIVGAYFSTVMVFDSIMEPSQLDEAVRQVGSRELLTVISCIQPVVLTLLCGFFGYILSEKVGLMRPFRFEKKPLLIALILSLSGGALMSLDAWTFAQFIPGLDYHDAGRFDLPTWISSVLYGGITEEVMMRLFLMSLLALLMWKIFFRKRNSVPTGAFVAANVIAALLFAAGHLPVTAVTFGALTPLLLLRCFLLNGAFGLLFGRLYRQYGIQYAMLSHMLLHAVSRTIWIIAF